MIKCVLHSAVRRPRHPQFSALLHVHAGCAQLRAWCSDMSLWYC